MKKGSKPFEKVLPIAAALTIILGTIIVYRHKKQVEEAIRLPYYSISLEKVADGCYKSKTYTSFQHLQLEVTVENHQLKKIEVIENEGSQGYKAAEIIDEMVEQNRTAVPVIEKDKLGSMVFISCVDSALLEGLSEEDRNLLK